ncbi:MAG: hypothetical protein QM820_35480 [Minicystis sp.]
MMAFSRVAYICKCPTRISAPASAEYDVPGLRVRTGTAADLPRLPAEICPPDRLDRLEARLVTGEILVLGELEGRIVSLTWLRREGEFALHHLPAHPFRLAEGHGYGYDAWTDPTLRGQGIRRAVFAEELRILDRLGISHEVSYFVDHQLDGGRRNLARIGVPLIELWKLTVRPGGAVALQALSADGAVSPCFVPATEESRA